MLITEDRPYPVEHWTAQLPRLLEPQGVTAYVARSGREAIDVAHRVQIHAAVIDWGTPIGQAAPCQTGSTGDPTPDRLFGIAGGGLGAAAGMWLLELFKRLPNHPAIVVVLGPAVSQRQFDRLMRDALRLGVFSVVNKPVDLEQMLTVFRRVIDRRYRGTWPMS